MCSEEEQRLFEQSRKKIFSPSPLEKLEELEHEIQLHPRYVGPGLWYDLITAAGTGGKEARGKKEERRFPRSGRSDNAEQ